MLPKKYRLTGQKNFKLIATKGKTLFLKELGIKWLPNKLKHSCFAFIVSTQIDKKAVMRNKIKRRLCEIIHHRLKEIKPGFGVLIIARHDIKNLRFQPLKEKLENLLRRAKLL